MIWIEKKNKAEKHIHTISEVRIRQVYVYLIQLPWRLTQEDLELEASLSIIIIPYLNTQLSPNWHRAPSAC